MTDGKVNWDGRFQTKLFEMSLLIVWVGWWVTDWLGVQTFKLQRISFTWLVRELVMVDNKSDREGGLSLPDGVARVCLVSVKQTEHNKN